MAEPLTFHPLQRSRLAALTTTEADGRAVAPLSLRLHVSRNGVAESFAQKIDLHLAGPGDVQEIRRESILLLAPPPNARNAETTKLVHVDFRAPDLPWRYSPDPGADPRPWLALLVGTREEFTVAGKLLTFASDDAARDVLAAYDVAAAKVWAHVQESPGARHGMRRISRLVAMRGREVVNEKAAGLRPQTEYTAAIVAAFDGDGAPAWSAAARPATLPVHHSWRFWTGEEGDFETLALAITPRPSLGLGRVTLHLPRVPDPHTGTPISLEMRGAIGSLADEPPGGDAPAEVKAKARALLSAAQADLEALRAPTVDHPPPGHPPRTIVGLPDLGRPWLTETDAAEWSRHLNGDPRLRGSAGLGGWIGREAQEDLIAAAVEQMGAMQAALQRISQLALGLEAARGLWQHRLPQDTGRRLRVFGPATARMQGAHDGAGDGASVQSAVTGPDSPLPQAFLTSAAMRVLRRGTARTRGADGAPDGAFRPAGALADAANSDPPPPEPVPSPLAHVDGLADAMGLSRLDDLRLTAPIPEPLLALIARYAGRVIDDEWTNQEFFPEFEAIVHEHALEDFTCGRSVLEHLHGHAGEVATVELLCQSLLDCRILASGLDTRTFAELLGRLGLSRDFTPAQLACLLGPDPTPADARRPRNLDLLVERIAGLVDPTRPRPPGWRRVESTITGLRLDTLAPPEMPVSLEFPTWTLLNRHDKEWLLPGVGSLEKGSVIALKTNPRFVAAFLAGINSQFLHEMHWRNLPVDRTSTPLLQFWGQFDYATQRRQSDILPIGEWETTKELGDRAHQWVRPGDPTGREDVVFVFRTDLFRRYPSTLVYLSRRTGEDLKLGPDLSPAQAAVDPALRKELGPIYQGQIEPDIVFFAFDIDPSTVDQYQLVLDEPPAELRFRNDRGAAAKDGAAFAAATIDRHSRVAFLGSHLEERGLHVE
jgi:hypothetical protein